EYPQGERTRSKLRVSCPCARSRSRTCEPMNPEPPVTSTLMAARAPPALVGRRAEPGRELVPTKPDPPGFSFAPVDRPVVKRHTPVVLRDPVGVRQVDVVAQQAVAGLVVDLAGRAVDRVENDVLVEPGGHSGREDDAVRVH